MNIKNTKQPIMGLAALFVLFYHLFPTKIGTGIFMELANYFVMIGYIGVDMFFFLSGYMLMFSHTDNYLSYSKRRLLRIYPLFILSVIIYGLMGNLTPIKAFKTLINVDIFTNGGASFLWFLQGIILLYFFVPLYKHLLQTQNKMVVTFIALLCWTVVMLFLEDRLDNHSANIFLCRIPIFILAMTLAGYEAKGKNKNKILLFLPLFILGILLSFNFGYKVKANYPITNIFYLYAIPLILGIIGLADCFFSTRKLKVLDFLGGISLELYCFQMIFGSLLFTQFFSLSKNVYFTFTLVIIAIILISFITNRIISWLTKKI